MNDQGATTHDGHGLDASEQRTGRRTDADACSLRHTQKGSRAEVLPGALGRSSKQREPPRNPAQESYGARNRERSSEIGSAALLSASGLTPCARLAIRTFALSSATRTVAPRRARNAVS